jgi:hypothetical protein
MIQFWLRNPQGGGANSNISVARSLNSIRSIGSVAVDIP